MAQFGIVKEVVEMPDPAEPSLPEALVAKEQAFAGKAGATGNRFPDSICSTLAGHQYRHATGRTTGGGGGDRNQRLQRCQRYPVGTFQFGRSGGKRLRHGDAWAGLKYRLPGILAGGVNG